MDHYDLLIRNGRVLDAESHFDSVADVAISSGLIDRIEPEIDPALADDTIDASGQWVMPGMVDTHVHVAGARDLGGSKGLGLQMVAAAGATTVLDLGGRIEILAAGIAARGSGVNVGSLLYLRPGETVPEGRLDATKIRDVVGRALDAGSLGVKILGGYYPFTPDETAQFISSANDMGAYIAYHVGTTETGSRLDGVREIPALLGGSGRVHVAHINAYCRGSVLPVEQEIREALQIIEDLRDQVVSEVHLARPNFTRGKSDAAGHVLADVCRNCLRLKDYEATADGIRAALRDGYASTVEETRTGLVLVTGERGVELFDEGETDVSLSFPVNSAESAFQLTAARRSTGNSEAAPGVVRGGAGSTDAEFVIDAIGSDAGVLPRNVNIEQAMRLVKFGALEPLDVVLKLSLNPARMIGLDSKGRLSEGKDADLTLIDPVEGRASYGVVAGRVIMMAGRVVGTGGTILTTGQGTATVASTGIPFETVDITQAMMYAGRRG
ncbi:MAG: amidohydrolase family protein [Chloroflexi bacterium]|nr:amidohydrolase family protein [Chloroflexota bacterium]